MRANIKRVIKAFLEGRVARGDSKNTCRVEWYGNTGVLYSYAMPIACNVIGGHMWICRYEHGPSRTTKSQIRACQLQIPAYKTTSAQNIRRIAAGMQPEPEIVSPVLSGPTLFDPIPIDS